MRRSRMVIGKLRALKPDQKQRVADIVSLRLAGTLGPSRAGTNAALRLSIAKLTGAKSKLDPSSIDWLVMETNLICLELLVEAPSLQRTDQRETIEQLQVLGELLVRHASEPTRTALSNADGWPYSRIGPQ